MPAFQAQGNRGAPNPTGLQPAASSAFPEPSSLIAAGQVSSSLILFAAYVSRCGQYNRVVAGQALKGFKSF